MAGPTRQIEATGLDPDNTTELIWPFEGWSPLRLGWHAVPAPGHRAGGGLVGSNR
jgi:hypothetical protein